MIPACPNITALQWHAYKCQEIANAENKSAKSPAHHSKFTTKSLLFMKILVINPGSTSTKIAVYENETPLFVSNIKHSVEELSAFPEVIDQFEFRKNLVLQE